MFDYISVADKLPTNDVIVADGLNLPKEQFQTKDLHNCLEHYFIQGGKLFVEKYKSTKWVEDSEAFAGGYIDRQDPYIEEINHHGKINFYHLIDHNGYDYWVEYDAYFTHGVLEKIELVKFKKDSNADKKARMEELFNEIKVMQNKWYNKYLFHTSGWTWFRKNSCRALYALERGIGHLRIHFP